MSINLETGVWYCFAQCGGGDWFELINRMQQSGEYAPVPLPADTSSSAVTAKPVLKSLLERGFTREMLGDWDIEWDSGAEAMRIPVYQEDGVVLGNIWRAPEGVQPKYRYDAGLPKKMLLFGGWRLSRPVPRLYFVEGPLDAVWMQAAQLPAVAVLGSHLSAEQIALAQSYGMTRAVLCFDNDTAGYKAAEEAAPVLRRLGIWVYRVRLPSRYKDPQEVPLAKLNRVCTTRAELCVNGHGFLHQRYQRWTGGVQGNSTIWRTAPQGGKHNGTRK